MGGGEVRAVRASGEASAVAASERMGSARDEANTRVSSARTRHNDACAGRVSHLRIRAPHFHLGAARGREELDHDARTTTTGE
jgi:hypothetical protein